MESKRYSQITLLIILAFVAMAVHLVTVAESNRHAPFQIPVIDAASYHWQAVEISQGQATPARAFWQPPLYPYWLATVYTCLSPDVGLARYVQGLFPVLIVVLTFLVGKRLASARIAFLAALALCFYGPLVFFSGMLLPNAMAAALDMVVLLCLLRLAETPTPMRAVACGASFGLAALAVPNVALALCIVGGWLVWWTMTTRHFREAVILGSLVGLGFLCCVAPISIRNRIVSGEWVPISTNGGINFYIGNNPRADETQAIRPGDDWAPLVSMPYQDGARSDAEADHYFFRKAGRYLLEDPAGFLRNLGLKAVRFWNAREVSRNIDVEYFCSLSPALRPFVWHYSWLSFPFGILGTLGIFGLITSLHKQRDRLLVGAFVLVYALSVILFFPASRYKLPIIAPLMIFAVMGVEYLVGAFRQNRIRAWGLLGLLVGIAVFVNWPISTPTDRVRLDAELHTDVGIGLQTRGQLAEALTQYDTALAVAPTFAEALYYRGTALREMGRKNDAMESFRRCLTARQDHLKAMHDLALLLFENRHSMEEAIQLMRAVVTKRPTDQQAMINLGIMLSRTGHKEEAALWLKKAGAIPAHATIKDTTTQGSGVQIQIKPE